jgi:hypothetical protein
MAELNELVGYSQLALVILDEAADIEAAKQEGAVERARGPTDGDPRDRPFL